MKKTKQQLSNFISEEVKKNVISKQFTQKNVALLFDKYQIPEGISSDILTLRTNPIDYSEYILYCILDIINEEKVTDFFTEKEINIYSSTKYVKETISFPIKFNVTQITDDQWIGSITVKELMMLRDAQLIRYNENTQRTLNHIIEGNIEHYQIAINRKAVKAIIDSYENGLYIPNTITLNMPEISDFKYTNGKLTINDIDAFDIIDGYHRYIGMSSIYNMNPNFDYMMELRIVCFSEEKAKQFIWQEDQKTKMRKIDSDTFNQNDPANQVINFINQSGLLRNVISQTGALDFGETAVVIRRGYFRKKTTTRADILEIRNKLIKRMNALLESDPHIYDKKWDNIYLKIAFVLFNEEIPDEELLNEIDKFSKIFEKLVDDDMKIRLHAIFTSLTFDKISEEYRKYKGI